MMPSKDYVYTNYYEDCGKFVPQDGSTYIYGYSPEDRSHLADSFVAKYTDRITFVKIGAVEKDLVEDFSQKQSYRLRSDNEMASFLDMYRSPLLYIDITGLNSRICAALLRHSIKAFARGVFDEVRVVYAEPESYKIMQFKTEGVFNDLSEQIDGIEPLPGFASIFPTKVEDSCYVPLLGFEGGRFTHMLECFQPPFDNIHPVIGVPGFRFEYPFIAYWGNRQPLEDSQSWRNIKYAAANSPVDVFVLLSKIHNEMPGSVLKIAPIGTKPHAIGAMLYVIKHPDNSELIYDNPKRKKKRTTGIGRIMECSVSRLLEAH